MTAWGMRKSFKKVSIKKSVIGKHTTIGEKVKISNSVIMDHVTIKEG